MTTATHTAVDCFLDAVAAGEGIGAAFAPDAELDATVPNWRFGCRGRSAIDAQLAGWYANPGRFEELRRTPLEAGELVEFTLVWEEDGVPYAAHQVHVLRLNNTGLIGSDHVWCGGRWGAALLAEMEATQSGPGSH